MKQYLSPFPRKNIGTIGVDLRRHFMSTNTLHTQRACVGAQQTMLAASAQRSARLNQPPHADVMTYFVISRQRESLAGAQIKIPCEGGMEKNGENVDYRHNYKKKKNYKSMNKKEYRALESLHCF